MALAGSSCRERFRCHISRITGNRFSGICLSLLVAVLYQKSQIRAYHFCELTLKIANFARAPL
jgi:hypothetical protein